MIKILDKIDISNVQKELDSYNLLNNPTCCLQGVTEDQDIFYGIGSVFDFNHNNKECSEQEKDFKIPLFDMPYINSIMEKYNMYRTRLMRQTEVMCYTYHQDFSSRIHIPVVTNENCLFILEDKIHRLNSDGTVYWVDTTKKHTAVNASRKNRYHIVGCVNA